MGAAEKQAEVGEFSLTINGTERDMGTMQYAVLKAVSEARYDDGFKILQDYKHRKFGFPPFKKRTEKLLSLCEEHIQSIRNKLGIPNLKSMLAAKQEEVYVSATENWEHLTSLLKRLRSIEREFASADAKSSLIVIKAVMFSCVMILSVFLIKETFKTIGGSFGQTSKDVVRLLMKVLFG